jgi:thymidylate synthase
MSFHIEYNSLETIYRKLMRMLDTDPDFSSAPRGKPIHEFIGSSFTLTDPRNRLVTSPARKMNYGFAVGELCWYLRGDTDLETMAYYNRRMSQFSDDGKTINSAYGYRMFRDRFTESGWVGVSQLDNVIDELRRDPDSRRAVMHINEPNDLRRAVRVGSKDVPCTMSIQLLVRDRRLHMHVLMRSNDVIWGLPYDVFSFTCLQEAFLYMLQEAGIPVDDLGFYHHTAGSLHVYDTHFGMAADIKREWHQPPAPMRPFTLATLREIAEQCEPAIRKSAPDGVFCNVFEGTEAWMFERLLEHRTKRNAEAGLAAITAPIVPPDLAVGSDTKENDVQQT